MNQFNIEDKNKTVVDEYMVPGWKRAGFWIGFASLLVALGLFLHYRDSVETHIPIEELVTKLEVCNVRTEWIVNETIKDEEGEFVIIVPQITFQVKNRLKEPLDNVYFLGVFRFTDTGKTIGEGYSMAMKKAVAPGGVSEKIVLKSVLGYRASSPEALRANMKNWKKAYVELYARKNSKLANIKPNRNIVRRIKGLDIEMSL